MDLFDLNDIIASAAWRSNAARLLGYACGVIASECAAIQAPVILG
jgi:hypothetical protein